MKLIIVGDVHAVPEELDDCAALIDLVRDVASNNDAGVLFLGDQFHTHAVIRSEVMWFWRQAFTKLRNSGVEASALVGNHDFSGPHSPIHSMASCADVVRVVDKPFVLGGVVLVPYMDDHDIFVRIANESTCSTLICHQTFSGSKYENGMYAPDGIDPELIPQKLIISGHIHTPQSFGRVTYVGSPRWRTLSDANIERALWLYEFDAEGRVVSKKSFDTGETCRQIRYVLDTPDDPFTGTLDPRFDWRVDVRGPAAYVEERRKQLAGPGVRLRSFKEERRAPVVRESEGIDVAFAKFAEKFRGRRGTSPEVMSEMVRRYLG